MSYVPFYVPLFKESKRRKKDIILIWPDEMKQLTLWQKNQNPKQNERT